MLLALVIARWLTGTNKNMYKNKMKEKLVSNLMG